MDKLQRPRLGGHLLVQCLIAQGVTHVFGVPGESFLAVLDGFYDAGDAIRFVVNRQEGGAAFMAEAYGKLTGRAGVCIVTRGPGATNASIGVHTAFQDSTPMVLLVGDVAADTRDREAFQALDYSHFFGPGTGGMAKRVERIDDVRRIPEAVARAFATAHNGRPGPVVLVLPEDILNQALPGDAPAPLPAQPEVQAEIGPHGIHRLREALLNSERPMLLVGGPGWTPQAAQALQDFAQAWQLPVTNAFRFQDTFDNHHPNYAGDVGLGLNPALARRLQDADLIVALGVRLGEITTGGYTWLQAPRPRQRLVHVHPGADELNRVYQADLALCAGVASVAPALAALPAPTNPPWRDWTAAAHADYLASLQPQPLPGAVDMAAVVACIQRLLPADAVLTNGAGNFASWLHRFFRYPGRARGGRTQLAPTNGAMGYGVPAGIAAALTTGRTVLTLTGDGDFLMTGQELATAVQHGAKTIVVLINNGLYGTIRMHQARTYPGRISGTQLRNPDFCALAQSYGYASARVQRTAEFEPALQAALARPEGTLIEIMLDPECITTRASLRQIENPPTHG
ncbi:MAG: thiamine pyrophosphate-binding protein [Rhodoferax sp.]